MPDYPIFPRTGSPNGIRQVFWLTDHSTLRPFPSRKDSGFTGFRPRLQRRDRSRISRDSLLNSKVPDAKSYAKFLIRVIPSAVNGISLFKTFSWTGQSTRGLLRWCAVARVRCPCANDHIREKGHTKINTTTPNWNLCLFPSITHTPRTSPGFTRKKEPLTSCTVFRRGFRHWWPINGSTDLQVS